MTAAVTPSAVDEPPAAELTAAELAALFPPRKAPTRPVVIPLLPETPRVHATLQHLAADIAVLLAGRRPILVRSMGTYLGYDTFPLFTVCAEGEVGQNTGPRAAVYLCSAAVQATPPEDLDAAIVAAQRRLADDARDHAA